jgi:ferritin-like metal-binding protein YciE
MPSEKTLRDLFHDTLKDIYFAEKKILTALPKMAKAAQAQDLKSAFEKHETKTEGHVERLEEVFAEIDELPRGKTCDAIVGIIDEGQEVMKEYKGTPGTLLTGIRLLPRMSGPVPFKTCAVLYR